MIGYLVRENVSRAGARNHRFDGGEIDYVCTGVHWLANGIIECYTRKLCDQAPGLISLRGHGANRGRATRDYDTTPTSIEVGIVVRLMTRVEPMIHARYSRVNCQPRSLKTVARGLPNTP